MTDLAKTIVPKSDQLNADDLIAGPRTITITEVRGCDGEQPIAVNFEGDDRKPYMPCKSMRRVMVHAWGPDGKTYPGKRMTLYCDPNVQFGGIKVGGIRISHMSHIDRDLVIPLTVTRAKRAPYTVKPLRAETRPLSRPAERRPAPPREDPPAAETEYSRGFGQAGTEPETAPADDAPMSAAVEWMNDVYADLEGDVFRSTADLDAFFADPTNVSQFEALKAEDAAKAKRLEAALTGKGKALASHGRR